METLISIIALNYNQSDFLIESLNAIAGQSYRNFELIITDDFSTDDSREKIDKWIEKHPEINIIKSYNESNLGLCKTLNRAIRLSKGEYIKPIACDDVLHMAYLEKAVQYFSQHENIRLLCTDMQLINEHSVVTHISNWDYAGVVIDDKKINEFEAYIPGPFLNTPSLCFQSKLYEDLGGYDEQLVFEDWDFILRAKRYAKFGFIKESLVNYRIHNSNMHKNIGRQIQYSIDIIKLLQKHFGISTVIDNKIRSRIADEICSLLLIDEDKAISVWSDLYVNIKKEDKGKQPLLSVLTSVYNTEQYIANAIECILLQTYSNIQLVIVTDPCTDRTIEIIKDYAGKYPNITLVENQQHLGIISSFNIGLKYCTGEFIARMDLDDLIHPQRFEKQMIFLAENPQIDVVSSWMKIFDEKQQVRNVTYRSDSDLHKISMLFYSPISHAASVFKASVLKNVGYIEDYKYAEDYDLWFRILKMYQISVFPEYLYFYRTHSNQVTNPKNIEIARGSLRKIAVNILNSIGVKYTNEELEFHLEYIMLNKPLDSPELFSQFNDWMNKILLSNKKSHFFIDEKFRDFVFTNYWQSLYLIYRQKLKTSKFTKILNSPFNRYGIRQKSKDILKQVLNK